MFSLTSNNIDCLRSIYIADILRKHVVCSPSLLKTFSLSFLQELSNSNTLFILDPSDFVRLNNNQNQIAFFTNCLT